MSDQDKDELQQKIDGFMDKLKHGKLSEQGSFAIASSTLSILRLLIEDSSWKSAQDLMASVRQEGRGLISRCGQTSVSSIVGNMVRRVLKLIREESSNSEDHSDQVDSLRMNVAANVRCDSLRPIPELKNRLLEGFEELNTELEVASEEIAEQALQHIHANEVILTLGKSKTVEQFLISAADKGRKFQVIVAECAPNYQGQMLARSLAAAKIQTTLIPDSAVFAVMSRVNKVIIGTHRVLANGGLKAITGTNIVALAAKHYSVPIIVCASMHKLTPKHCSSADNEAFSQFASPQDSLRGLDGQIISKVDAYNPIFEYVPPELVTLFISNMGGNAPSYVYRLLSELYHPDDYEL